MEGVRGVQHKGWGCYIEVIRDFNPMDASPGSSCYFERPASSSLCVVGKEEREERGERGKKRISRKMERVHPDLHCSQSFAFTMRAEVSAAANDSSYITI